MIVGRSAERGRIADLVKAARGGEGGALVITGEAGIGKSALLADAAAQRRMAVVRVVGAPSERDLSWAGLHSLLTPFESHLDGLPDAQREAVATVLAMTTGRPDRLSVAAGTLSLLSAASSVRPLLVVVDDAHWLDQPSAEAIGFVARRLGADAIAVLVALRSDEPGRFPLHGLERIDLTGLDPDDARSLARAVAPQLAEEVAAQLVSIAAGHPLGLIEMASRLTPEQEAGIDPLPDQLAVGPAVEELYRARLDGLPDATRRAALTVALGAGPAAEAVAQACLELGLSLGDLEPAEHAGLIEVTPAAVSFRHPLVRSALQSLAAGPELRQAHLAVAQTLPAESDAAVWHRARAALEPDEELAEALNAIGSRDRESSLLAAEAAFGRAAELTTNPALRAERLLRAAQAGWEAGHGDRSAARLQEVLDALGDAGLRREAVHLLARIEAAQGSAADAAELLMEEADAAEHEDPARAARMLADSVEPWLVAGEPERAYAAGRRARVVAPADDTSLLVELDLRAADVLGWQGRPREAAALWQRVVETVEADGVLLRDPWSRYRAGEAAFSAGADAAAITHIRAALDLAREGGAIGAIPYMSIVLVWALCRMGDLDQAATRAADGVTLAAALGRTGDEAWALAALAWVDAHRGDEQACRRNAERADHLGSLLKLDGLESSSPALGLLELARGDYEHAAAHLENAVAEHERRGGTGVGTPRLLVPLLVEALIRAGRSDEGGARLEPFEAAARDAERADAIAAAIRCRALLEPGEDALVLFAEAIALHDASGHAFERARTQLCLGERLRRMRRRADARTALRAADDVFAAAGAAVWSARAQEELAATGQRRRGPDPAERDRLTPHEQQVARLVATGLTNREVAARLFLSEKTIETHLTRIYLKLGVRSRTALAAAIGAQQERGIPDSTSAATA